MDNRSMSGEHCPGAGENAVADTPPPVSSVFHLPHMVDVVFGRAESESRRHCLSEGDISENPPATAQKSRRWCEIAVSAVFLVLAFFCFLEFRGFPIGSIHGIPMVIGPIILGLAGAVSGMLARSPMMATLNFLVAFFLVPVYVMLFQGPIL